RIDRRVVGLLLRRLERRLECVRGATGLLLRAADVRWLRSALLRRHRRRSLLRSRFGRRRGRRLGQVVYVDRNPAEYDHRAQERDLLPLRPECHCSPPVSSLIKAYSLKFTLTFCPTGCGEACRLSMIRNRGDRSSSLMNFARFGYAPS